MGGIPLPKPCFLDDCEAFGVRGQKKIWRSSDGVFFYTWDSLHGEIEVFNRRGRHMGALDAKTGEFKKNPVKGRKIDV
jgi:hypothetical protein